MFLCHKESTDRRSDGRRESQITEMTELRAYATSVAGAIPVAVCWGLLAVFVIGAVGLLLWKGVRTGGRYVSALALSEWIALVLCATVIFRSTKAERGFRLIPFSSYWDFGPHGYLLAMVAENLLNVVLFLPVGILLGCGFKGVTWKRALVIGLVLSIAIEVLQFVFKKGFCEVDDVMHNALGSLIGFGIYKMVTQKLVRYAICSL